MGSSDPDQDALGFSWRDATGSLVSTGPVLRLMLAMGTHDLRLVVDDGRGGIASDDASATIVDTTPPVLSIPEPFIQVPAGEAGLDVTGLARASDACSTTVSLTNDAPPVFPLGRTRVTFTATDESGNAARASLVVNVVYDFDGMRPPVGGGDLIFHVGRTIPIKFRLLTVDGRHDAGAVAALSVMRVEAGGVLQRVTPQPAGDSNDANLFRSNEGGGQYIYNLKTTGFTPGEYLLIVSLLTDRTMHVIHVVLQ